MFQPNFESTPPANLLEGIRFEKDVPIPMRDGTRLATDLYLPSAPGRYPVLLERTPYGKHQSVMVRIQAPQYLAAHGFAVAVQDARGRYASEGLWYPFREEAWGTARDGFDSVEWLAGQPWSSGRVGVFGGSFAGFNQYLMAGDPNPHLGAMFTRQAPASLRNEWVYRGGAFELGFMFMWGARQSLETLRHRAAVLDRESSRNQMALLRARPLAECGLFSDPFAWIKEYLLRQEDPAYWRQWDISTQYGRFRVPTYHLASWYDIFLGGSLRNFIGMRAHASSPEARRSQRLTIGPWMHGPAMDDPVAGRYTGEMDFSDEARFNYKEAMAQWFDLTLGGKVNALADAPAVNYFMMGVNRWRTAEEWPPPGISFRNLYFHSERSGSAKSVNDGTARWHPPASDPPPAAFVHDPDKPTRSAGGNTLYSLHEQKPGEQGGFAELNAQAGSQDQRGIEPECLTFTSPPLDEDLDLTGPVVAKLYISSSAVDTDLVVRLCDVHPDGRSMLICDGIQRARYRDSDYEPSLLEPGKVYELSVDLWATSIRLFAGHRIRVVINSSNFPRFDVNPGTGESGATASRVVQAENRVYVDARRPSHIVLPLL